MIGDFIFINGGRYVITAVNDVTRTGEQTIKIIAFGQSFTIAPAPQYRMRSLVDSVIAVSEAMRRMAGQIDRDHYARGIGGGWNIMSDPFACVARAQVFEQLPIGIELETAGGLVGILHADCPASNWELLKDRLFREAGEEVHPIRRNVTANSCTWGRDRFKRMLDGPVEGVRAVVVGHNTVERVGSLDNVIFIDTGGWENGHFTVLDAETLRPASAPAARTLDWSES